MRRDLRGSLHPRSARSPGEAGIDPPEGLRAILIKDGPEAFAKAVRNRQCKVNFSVGYTVTYYIFKYFHLIPQE